MSSMLFPRAGLQALHASLNPEYRNQQLGSPFVKGLVEAEGKRMLFGFVVISFKPMRSEFFAWWLKHELS